MKILHIITRMNTGGPAVFLDHLTNSMSNSGTISIIAYGYCEKNETDYTDSHQLRADLVKIKSLHRSINPLDDIKSFFQIKKIIKTEQPDVVNTHTSKAGVLGRVAAKSVAKNIPTVHTFHGHLIYGYFAKYKTVIFTLIERFLARFNDAAVSITQETQSSLQKLGIGKKLNWQVIQLGVPLINPVSQSVNGGDLIKLLWVGRFTDIKDPFYALDVIENLSKSNPNKYELTMVGGGELFDQVKNKAKNLPVRFTGWMEKPFANAGVFDLLLLTSKNEGMGLVILEAANYSKATIARDVGGVGEFIQDGVNGLLINGSADLMSAKISSLSGIEILNLGTAARETLVKSFTDKAMADKYLNLYKSLI